MSRLFRTLIAALLAVGLSAGVALAVVCPKCEGEGKVRGVNVFKRKRCPRCNGTGRIDEAPAAAPSAAASAAAGPVAPTGPAGAPPVAGKSEPAGTKVVETHKGRVEPEQAGPPAPGAPPRRATDYGPGPRNTSAAPGAPLPAKSSTSGSTADTSAVDTRADGKQKCSRCEGRGKYKEFFKTVRCKRCGGTGVEPAK